MQEAGFVDTLLAEKEIISTALDLIISDILYDGLSVRRLENIGVISGKLDATDERGIRAYYLKSASEILYDDNNDDNDGTDTSK